MSNLENKEEKVLDKIVAAVNKLDKDLNELDTISENPEKSHKLKKWLVERKAIHEIKKILHEAEKYEKYDEKELDNELKEINDLLLWLNWHIVNNENGTEESILFRLI